MTGWLTAIYALAELLLVICAAYTALATRSPGRRKDGYKVLRLLLSTGAGSGLIGILLKLHQLGVIR